MQGAIDGGADGGGKDAVDDTLGFGVGEASVS